MQTQNKAQDLRQVYEDYEVYDLNGDHVGEVSDIYLGTTSDEAERLGEVESTAPARFQSAATWVTEIAQALDGHPMPEELRERLLNSGFVRIEGGLLQKDRYILADQIASVEGERVNLRIPGDQILEW